MKATLTHAINLPCTKVLSFDARNVLSGVLAVAGQDAEKRELDTIADARFGLGHIRINCPEWVSIDNMMVRFNQLLSMGLIEPHGVRYKLSDLLAIQYTDYKASQTPTPQ